MKIELVQGFQILFEKAKNIEFLMERMEKKQRRSADFWRAIFDRILCNE
jgi:hypothetical protein